MDNFASYVPPKTDGLGQGFPRRSKRLQDPTWADFGPTWPQLGTNLAPKSKPKSSRRSQNLPCHHRHRKWLQFRPKNLCFCVDFWRVLWLLPKSFFCSVTKSGCPKNIQKHNVFKGFLKIGFYTVGVTVSWKSTSRGLEIIRSSQVNAGMENFSILAWFWSRFRIPNRCQNGPEKG